MLAAARRAGCSRPLRLSIGENGRQIASTARRRAAGDPRKSFEDTLQRLHDDDIDHGRHADGSARHLPEASVRHVMQKSAENLPDTYHEDRAAMQATIGVMLARYRLGKAQNASNPVLEARHRILAYVRAVRKHSNVAFLSLADGSLDGAAELSAVLHKSNSNVPAALKQDLAPGVAVELVGKLKERNAPQEVEFVIETARITGRCDAATYPIPLTVTASKATSTSADAAEQNLRRYAHLRPRDMRHVNILRMRSTIERAIDGYFAEEDFVRVAAPIITSSDCEGGGEVFRVTRDEAGKGRNDFWSGSRAYLTVSAQLHLEALTQGLGRVCTTGPAFRAEGSATNRHLAEFWMCEAELMTYGNAGMALAQVTTTVENVVRAAMEAALSSEQAMSYLWRDDASGLAALRRYLRQGWSWPRHTYSGAIKALHEAAQSKHEETSTTETAPSMPPQWGEALSSEHERYLARNGPVFITHYPAHLKPFYMRRDGQGSAGQATAACFDLLMPGLGELAGGSLRESNGPNLFRQMAEAGVKSNGAAPATSSSDSNAPGDAGKQTDLFAPLSEHHPLHWYGEIRKYGAAPTGGFGIGIERLIAWLTNTRSVRDVVTFPRVKGPLRY